MADSWFDDGGNSTCRLGITAICDRSLEELFADSRTVLVLFLSFMVLVLVVGHFLHLHDLQSVPESLVVVILGGALGCIIWIFPIMDPSHTLNPRSLQLTMSMLLNFFALPIIIFESGWSLHIRGFFSQIGYIMLFAIFGTLICVAVVACLIMYLPDWTQVHSWRTALTFASLISSTDPVATLATFSHLNVDPLLFVLVFGESQINDAVAITLFRSLNELHDVSGGDSVWPFLSIFCRVLFGSIFLGVVFSFVYIIMMRVLRMGESPAQAILFIFVSPFLTFSVAESLGLSGIIAVLFNSLFMGSFVGPHLSADAMVLCSYLLKQVADLADRAIFLLSGCVMVFLVASPNSSGVYFGLYVGLFCLLGRALAIVPLGVVSNGIKLAVAKRLPREKEHRFTFRHLFMMWHSGLRGGVSLMLVLELGEWVDEVDGPGTKEMLVNGTFVIVVVFLLVFASTTGVFLRLLGIKHGDEVPPDYKLYRKTDKHGIAWRMVQRLREHVLLPLLVGAARRPPLCSALGAPSPRPTSEDGRDISMGELRRRVTSSEVDEDGSQDLRRRGTMLDLFGSVNPAHEHGHPTSESESDEGSEAEEGEASCGRGSGSSSDGA